MNWLLEKFAAIKSNPLVWKSAIPVLISLCVHFDRFWYVPIILYVVVQWEAQKVGPDAQTNHALIGLLFTSNFSYWGLLVAPVFVLIEWYIDPKYENAPFFNSGLIDTIFYFSGLAVGLIR